MHKKSEKMARIASRQVIYQSAANQPNSKKHKERFPLTNGGYEFNVRSQSNNAVVNRTKEVISDPSLNGRATVNKVVYSNNSYRVFHRPESRPFQKEKYTVQKVRVALKETPLQI